jgi:hypothetical protein
VCPPNSGSVLERGDPLPFSTVQIILFGAIWCIAQKQLHNYMRLSIRAFIRLCLNLRSERPGFVARFGKPLYRRLAIGGPHLFPGVSNSLRINNPRYSRMPFGATSQAKMHLSSMELAVVASDFCGAQIHFSPFP